MLHDTITLQIREDSFCFSRQHTARLEELERRLNALSVPTILYKSITSGTPSELTDELFYKILSNKGYDNV